MTNFRITFDIDPLLPEPTRTVEADEVDLIGGFFTFRTYKSKTPFLYIRADQVKEIKKVETPVQR